MIVGCYSLHLYCDAKDHVRVYREPGSAQAEFTAETGGECRRDARKLGWVLRMRSGRAICPACAKRTKNPSIAIEKSAEKPLSNWVEIDLGNGVRKRVRKSL